MNYLDLGFDQSFERHPQKRITSEELPDVTPFTADSIIQQIPGSKIAGGVIESQDGKLKIDLEKGQFLYNDGVVDLLSLGGASRSLTVKDSNGTTLISS